MDQIIFDVKNALHKVASQKRQQTSQRFFKKEVKTFGCKTADVTVVSRKFFRELMYKDKDSVFGLCEDFWKEGTLEETYIAAGWSYNVRKQFVPDDIKVFRRWIEKYVTNWAACDTFCNHTVGAYLEMFPPQIRELDRWAVSDHRWMKRAAAVSLIIPARKGLFLNDILRISEILLNDDDDMVQKGYGWLLKVGGNAHPKEVFDYVMAHNHVMPRTALRYAIEKWPADLKKEAMAK